MSNLYKEILEEFPEGIPSETHRRPLGEVSRQNSCRTPPEELVKAFPKICVQESSLNCFFITYAPRDPSTIPSENSVIFHSRESFNMSDQSSNTHIIEESRQHRF